MSVRWLLVALLSASSAFAQSPKEDLAPFLEEGVVAVIRIRPDKIQDATLADLDRKLTPAELRGVEGWKSPLSIVRERAKEWTAAGGGDAYVVVSFQDLPRRPPFMVLSAGKKPEELTALVKSWDANLPAETLGKVIVIGHSETIARLKAAEGTERPDLLQALTAAPDEAIRAVVAPSAATRRVYRELLPPLPPGLTTATAVELFDSAKLITAHVDLSAEPALKFNLQAKDAAAAEKWKEFITNAAKLATGIEGLRKEFPGLQKPAADPAPVVKGDRVEMVWSKDGDRLGQLIGDILQPALHTAHQAAANAESMNDLKQIMLALHNHHDARKAFPPQAILSKDGKKLLSWRVALLPFLDEGGLYQEFKLDEPWDSEHNRKLIPRMPAVYASNLLNAGRTKAGFTPYVAPVGEGTCFGGAKGVSLKQITDGTSNTVGIVLAIPSAVEWTKPQDWEIDFKNIGKGLRREPADPKDFFAAGYCDGSVRRISASISDEMLQRLVQIADGNVVEVP